jgi:hypothetical protein
MIAYNRNGVFDQSSGLFKAYGLKERRHIDSHFLVHASETGNDGLWSTKDRLGASRHIGNRELRSFLQNISGSFRVGPMTFQIVVS